MREYTIDCNGCTMEVTETSKKYRSGGGRLDATGWQHICSPAHDTPGIGVQG